MMLYYSAHRRVLCRRRHLLSRRAIPHHMIGALMESLLPMPDLEAADPEVADLIRREERRQFDGIELIASENYVSAAVQEAMANVMTNKYAEGLPGKRYYGGCEVVDEVERLAIARAKEIF